MKLTYIYTLSDDTSVRYVGKSNNPLDRLRYHKKECKKQRTHKEKWLYSLLKAGKNVVLEILDEIPEENWCEEEVFWISQLRAWGFKLVNGTSGGDGSDGFKGRKHSIETKLKCSEAAKKVVFTAEVRNKISESNKIRTFSKASKEKMSKSATLRVRVSMSQETKNKISSSLKKKKINTKHHVIA